MPHRVANRGSIDRIHLVIDCVVNDWLKDTMAQAKKRVFDEPANHEETLLVIQALRDMQTETGNRLADEIDLQMCK